MRALAWVALAVLGGCVVDAPCPPGASRCAGVCVDENVSFSHCGACYHACAAGESCEAGRCAAPNKTTCTDGMKNGSETAVDCGGGSCPACDAGVSCAVDSDCASTHCKPDHFCALGSCDDGVRDGTESDVDCGGACATRCAQGARCSASTDCDAGQCLVSGICGTEGLTLTSDHSLLVTGAGETATLTATWVMSGAPVVDAGVSFTMEGGGYFVLDGGNSIIPVTRLTDSSGAARVRVGPQLGASEFTVTAHADTLDASTTIAVQSRTIVWVSTECSGSACFVLGSRGSGFNETARVTFEVDANPSMPIAGVPVVFSISSPPGGVMFTASAVTDANGRASCDVSSGQQPGAFTVHAAVDTSVAVDSPTLSIVSAKATNRYWNIECGQTTLVAYNAATPPSVSSTPCQIQDVVDRYGSPLPFDPTFQLRAEAGSVPGAVIGLQTFTFTTTGTFPPANVTALPADSSQAVPGPRAAEPATDGGANPRDGLVTVLVYTQGEEWFDDQNHDGVRDPTEQFIDQGEPFVDADDNGVQNNFEWYLDTNQNGTWDGPNGSWDGTTTIWTDFNLLYSGPPDASTVVFSPASYGVCPGGVAKGSSTSLDLFALDARLNQIGRYNVAIGAMHSASKGAVTFAANPAPSVFGFSNDRVLINASGNACLPSDPICHWERRFATWGPEKVGTVSIQGADPNDVTPCAADTLTAIFELGGQFWFFSTTGAIE